MAPVIDPLHPDQQQILSSNVLKKKGVFISHGWVEGGVEWAKLLKVHFEKLGARVYLWSKDMDLSEPEDVDDVQSDVRRCEFFLTLLSTEYINNMHVAECWVHKEMKWALTYRAKLIHILHQSLEGCIPLQDPKLQLRLSTTFTAEERSALAQAQYIQYYTNEGLFEHFCYTILRAVGVTKGKFQVKQLNQLLDVAGLGAKSAELTSKRREDGSPLLQSIMELDELEDRILASQGGLTELQLVRLRLTSKAWEMLCIAPEWLRNTDIELALSLIHARRHTDKVTALRLRQLGPQRMGLRGAMALAQLLSEPPDIRDCPATTGEGSVLHSLEPSSSSLAPAAATEAEGSPGCAGHAPAWPALRIVDVSHCGLNVQAASYILTALTKLPSMTELDLGGNPLGDTAVSPLVVLVEGCTTLRRLGLSSTAMTDTGLAQFLDMLAYLQGCSLVQVDLSCNAAGSKALTALHRVLQYGSPRLAAVNLGENAMQSEDVMRLANVVWQVPLDSLDLSSIPVQPEGMQVLLEHFRAAGTAAMLPRRLILQSCGLKTEGGTMLAQLLAYGGEAAAQSLQELQVQGNKLGVQAVLALASVLTPHEGPPLFSHLVHLNLSGSRLGSHGAGALTGALLALPALTHLDLDNCGLEGTAVGDICLIIKVTPGLPRLLKLCLFDLVKNLTRGHVAVPANCGDWPCEGPVVMNLQEELRRRSEGAAVQQALPLLSGLLWHPSLSHLVDLAAAAVQATMVFCHAGGGGSLHGQVMTALEEFARMVDDINSQSSKLTKISMCGCKVTKDGAAALGATLASSACLRELSLGASDLRNTPACHTLGSSCRAVSGLLQVANLERPALRVLDLAGCKLICQQAGWLPPVLQALPHITVLTLDNTRLDDIAMSMLVAGVVSCPKLTHLNINGCCHSAQGMRGLALSLARATTLRSLSMRACHLDSEVTTDLAMTLNKHPSLTFLAIGGGVGAVASQLGNAGGVLLGNALERAPAITELDLSKCGVSDNISWALAAALARNTRISKVDLRFNLIGRGGAQQLIEAIKGRPFKKPLQVELAGNAEVPGTLLEMATIVSIGGLFQGTVNCDPVQVLVAARERAMEVQQAAAAVPGDDLEPPSAAAGFGGSQEEAPVAASQAAAAQHSAVKQNARSHGQSIAIKSNVITFP